MDIFSPANPDSLTTRLIGSHLVSIKDVMLPYSIPKSYDALDFNIGDRSEIKGIVKIVMSPAVENGHPQDLSRYLHEAVLNAYQHGNGKDESKTTRIGFDKNACFIVMDEGGHIRSQLITYVLALRDKERNIRPSPRVPLFYQFFSDIEITQENIENRNVGFGTRYMHRRFHVNYYLGELGGLAVDLKPKPYPPQ
jgi:hypothetical protein